MSDRIALMVALTIVALIALDLTVNGGGALLFLARKFAVLLDYLAFWR